VQAARAFAQPGPSSLKSLAQPLSAASVPGPSSVCEPTARGSYACLSFGSPHSPIFSYHTRLGHQNEELVPVVLAKVKRRRRRKLNSSTRGWSGEFKRGKINYDTRVKKYTTPKTIVKSLPRARSYPWFQLEAAYRSNLLNSIPTDDVLKKGEVEAYEYKTMATPSTKQESRMQTLPSPSTKQESRMQTLPSSSTKQDSRMQTLPSLTTIFVTPPPNFIPQEATPTVHLESSTTTESTLNLAGLFEYVWKAQGENNLKIPIMEEEKDRILSHVIPLASTEITEDMFEARTIPTNSAFLADQDTLESRLLPVEEDENIAGLEVESAEGIEDLDDEESQDAVELVDDDPIDQLAVSEEISEIFLKPLTVDLTGASLDSDENLAGEELDDNVFSETLSTANESGSIAETNP